MKVVMISVVVVVVMITAVTTNNSCELTKPRYTCPSGTETTVQLQFDQITLTDCNTTRQDKALFTNLQSVTYAQADQGSTYTLIIDDPDAPGHGEGQAWLHYIHTGLKGSDLAVGKLTGTDLVSYNPPGPPKGTGDHKYGVYVYLETGAQQDTEGPKSRRRFNQYQYTQRNGLCGPLDRNVFVAAYDDQEP